MLFARSFTVSDGVKDRSRNVSGVLSARDFALITVFFNEALDLETAFFAFFGAAFLEDFLAAMSKCSLLC